MILLDVQLKFQEEIIRRKQFLKLSSNAIVQSFIEKEQMIETFQVQYCDDSKQIQLIKQKTKQRVMDIIFIYFKQKIRNVFISPKSKRSENLIENNIFNFSGKVSLELLLFYFLNKTQKGNDAKLIEFLKKHKQKVELDGMIDETLNQIVVYKLHHHTHPQALVIIKQLQAKTQIEQLKLKYENQNLIIKYFMNIFNSSFKQCLIDASVINKKINLQKLSNQVQIMLLKQQSQLIKAWNQFSNIIDFVQLTCNVNPLTSFNIIQLLNSVQIIFYFLKFPTNKLTVIQISKNLIPDNKVQIELINKLKCPQIYSNFGKVRQLFLNLLLYIMEKNANEIIISLLEEYSNLNNTFTITITYKSQIKISKSELHHFPIINPLKFKDFKHNIRNSLYCLYISYQVINFSDRYFVNQQQYQKSCQYSNFQQQKITWQKKFLESYSINILKFQLAFLLQDCQGQTIKQFQKSHLKNLHCGFHCINQFRPICNYRKPSIQNQRIRLQFNLKFNLSKLSIFPFSIQINKNMKKIDINFMNLIFIDDKFFTNININFKLIILKIERIDLLIENFFWFYFKISLTIIKITQFVQFLRHIKSFFLIKYISKKFQCFFNF